MPFPRVWLRALIRLYPSQFRKYFGAEMLEVFDERWAECRATPSLPARTARTLRFLTVTSLNVMLNAVKEHLNHSLDSQPPYRHTPNRVFRSHSRGDSMIRTTLRDLRLAMRMLRRQPGFATVAVLTLSVGVGANAAIFSLVNGVLLQEMPYPEPKRLVTVWTSNVARGVNRWGVSLHDYTDWRERSDVFEDLAAWNQNTANLGGIDEPRRIAYAQVTPSLFTTLGTVPLHGRIFSPEENEPGQDGVIIVSRGFWERELGGEADALGQTLRLDGRPVTVVGVMPAGFAFPSTVVEVWTPFGMRPADEGSRGGRWVRAIARLERGMELEAAQSSLSALGSQLEKDFPETNHGFGIYIEPFMTTAVGGVSRTLYIFWGTAGLVLLIACGNLANLLLARSTGREREIGARAALGASGGQVARQLLAESVPIAVLGAVGGSVVAFASVRVLVRIGSGRIPRLQEVSVDPTVLLYSLALSLVVGFIFSALPALRASRLGLVTALKEGIKSSAGRRQAYARNTLVVGEIALAMVVVTGAGLLFRSYEALLSTDPGFEPENVLTVRLAPSWSEIEDRETVARLFDDVVQRVTAVPGVRSVSATNSLPLAGSTWGTTVEIAGRPVEPHERPGGLNRSVLPDYFRTMGIGLVRGRVFTPTDGPGARLVAVINEAAAQLVFPDEDPIGQRIRFTSRDFHTIVGIVANVQAVRLGLQDRPMFYAPFTQARFGHFQNWGMSFVIKSERDPNLVVESVRAAIAEAAPQIPQYQWATMDEMVRQDVAGQRFVATLIGSLAFIALFLAAIGVTGVLSYLVSQRTAEIGVRVALGAQRTSVLTHVLGHGASLALMGIGIGAVASAGLSRLLGSMLFGTSPLDPVTYVVVAAIIATAAVGASLAPALRAMRIDPLAALRAE